MNTIRDKQRELINLLIDTMTVQDASSVIRFICEDLGVRLPRVEREWRAVCVDGASEEEKLAVAEAMKVMNSL